MLIFQPYPTGGLRMSSKLTSKLHRGDLGPDLDNGEAAELDIENSRQEAQELQEEEATNPVGFPGSWRHDAYVGHSELYYDSSHDNAYFSTIPHRRSSHEQQAHQQAAQGRFGP
ncbi:hypothetical protein cyc_08688 [Cyclospora cayetanensis]|uniref:Uncharacterized protein n=1 Tax=Cyclospora cayetanensis TaxID=88456 RepID=A0A1D3CU70_9EIME|nr:hypothetical protein cyc_08688 [Cyclospora cayetanensis]